MFLPQFPPLLRWAVFFYLGHLIFQGKIAGSELGAFGAIFCVGWAAVRKEIDLRWHILCYPLAIYGIASTLSALLSFRRIHQGAEGMLWFKMLIFPCALTLLLAIPILREWALWAHMIFGSGIAIWGLIEYFFFDQRDLEHRINGPSTHVMTYSGLLLPLSLLFLVLYVHRRQWPILVSAILTSSAILLTFTRSVWLGWLIAVGLLLLVTRWRWLFYAIPLLLLFVTFMPEPLFGRLWSTFSTTQSSNLDRIRMLEAGVEIIRDYPLLGVGPANVKEIYPLYKKHDAPRFRPPHLHNNVVQIWAERGILALAGYLLLLALFVRECIRKWRGPGRMWAEAGVAVTVGLTYAGLFEFNFGDTEVFYLMLDLYALVIASLLTAEPAVQRPVPEPVPNEPLPLLVGSRA